MDSNSSGGNSTAVSEGSLGIQEARVKLEDAEGFQEQSVLKILTAAPPCRLVPDGPVPYLTESQMTDRIRQQRFTQEELEILVREIQARYHTIFNRGVPFTETRQAWDEVAMALNAAGVGPIRTANTCQRRYRDLKRRARLKVTNRDPAVKTLPTRKPRKYDNGALAAKASKAAKGQVASLDEDSGMASVDPPGPTTVAVDDPVLSQGPLVVAKEEQSVEGEQRDLRQPSRNHFTKEQMDVLLREIKARYHRLFGDLQHPLSFSDRRRAWEEVAEAINSAHCGPTKTASACCKRFSDFKRRRKMRLSEHKQIVSMCKDGPVITSVFSHSSPLGKTILPSFSMEGKLSSMKSTSTASVSECSGEPTTKAMPSHTSQPTLQRVAASFPPTALHLPAPTPIPPSLFTKTPQTPASATTPTPNLTSIPTQESMPTLDQLLALALTPLSALASGLPGTHSEGSTQILSSAMQLPRPLFPNVSPSNAAPSGQLLNAPPTPPLSSAPQSPITDNAGRAKVAPQNHLEERLLHVQREEIGALRRCLDRRLRRMESRTYPLLLTISRSLETIASSLSPAPATSDVEAPPSAELTAPRKSRAVL